MTLLCKVTQIILHGVVSPEDIVAPPCGYALADNPGLNDRPAVCYTFPVWCRTTRRSTRVSPPLKFRMLRDQVCTPKGLEVICVKQADV